MRANLLQQIEGWRALARSIRQPWRLDHNTLARDGALLFYLGTDYHGIYVRVENSGYAIVGHYSGGPAGDPGTQFLPIYGRHVAGDQKEAVEHVARRLGVDALNLLFEEVRLVHA